MFDSLSHLRLNFPRHVLQPEETVHPVSRTFYENEVFKTGVFVDQ